MGGLLSALNPALAAKHLDPESRQVMLECTGFNLKNHYDRQSPCDQDTLRKFVQDVSAAKWQGWFNGAVQEIFQAHGFFDPEGVFVGDGSYLFVPDNPAYEGSVVMWFGLTSTITRCTTINGRPRSASGRTGNGATSW